MRQFLVLALIVASATPVFADRASQNATRQRAAVAEREYRIRLAEAKKEAAIRQAAQVVAVKKAAAARREAAKQELVSQRSSNSNGPKTTGARQSNSQVSNQDAAKVAVGALLLGALILSMSDSGGGSDSASDDAQREANIKARQGHIDYWRDRAERETAAGKHDEAARSLEHAK